MTPRRSTSPKLSDSSAPSLLLLLLLAVVSISSARAAPTNEKFNSVAAVSLLPSPHTSYLLLRNSTASPCFDFSSPNISSHDDLIFSIPSLASAEETLAELTKQANEYLSQGARLKEAVVSVTASWTDEQRQTLSLSTKRSGTTLLRIINHPVSASIAYGLDREPYYPPDSTSGPWGRATVVVDVHGGVEKEVEAEITVLDVEEGVFEIVGLTTARGGNEQIERAVGRALEMAGTTAQRMDNYLIVGDTSLLPSLVPTLANLLSNAELWKTSSISTHLATVYGAAVQASFLGEHGCSSGDWVGAFEVTPRSLGVETSNGVLHRLVPRNYILPRRAVANFTTSEDGQTSASLRLFTGEHPSAEGNQLLATLNLEGLEPAAAGISVLKVVLDLSPSYEAASLSIEDLGSGRRSSIEIPLSYPRGTEWLQIEESIMALEKLDNERQQRGEAILQPTKGLPPIPRIDEERRRDEL